MLIYFNEDRHRRLFDILFAILSSTKQFLLDWWKYCRVVWVDPSTCFFLGVTTKSEAITKLTLTINWHVHWFHNLHLCLRLRLSLYLWVHMYLALILKILQFIPFMYKRLINLSAAAFSQLYWFYTCLDNICSKIFYICIWVTF